jgi:hypothetical protein
MAILSGKYEARIVIFRIFAAIDRISRISQKVESRWRKSESRWRNWKAVEEDFLGFLGNEKAVEENRTLSEENWILWEDFGEII